MKDNDLQQHVERALDWEPSIDAKDVAVSVDQGVVTLRGNMKTYSEKAKAERVALAVYGVKAVANDVNVRLADGQQRTDTEIAKAALAALRWNALVPADNLTVSVSEGWVTLKGQVRWDFERNAAGKAVRDLIGVRGVSNAIVLVPPVAIADVKSKIEDALKRNAEVDARRINVSVVDNKVILSGNVHSWFERSEARQAAWAAPGVKDVDDRIAVVP
jgi:osmotically-inducible protein OsmY